MANNLNVNFKAPICVIDAVRAVILAQYVWCQTQSIRKVWETLSEEQRQAVNKVAYECEMAARFFEVTLPKSKED